MHERPTKDLPQGWWTELKWAISAVGKLAKDTTFILSYRQKSWRRNHGTGNDLRIMDFCASGEGHIKHSKSGGLSQK